MTPAEPCLVFLSLGGNIGQPQLTLSRCIKVLQEWEDCFEVKAAKLYRTSPVDMADPTQPFINTAVSLKTFLSAHEFKERCQHLEREFGKTAKAKNAPRLVDIDIILFGNDFIQDPDLQIPHPRWEDRLFVLVPLSDLAENVWVPTGKNQGHWVHLLSRIASSTNPNQESIYCIETQSELVRPLQIAIPLTS